jgi:hypothetical protein
MPAIHITKSHFHNKLYYLITLLMIFKKISIEGNVHNFGI